MVDIMKPPKPPVKNIEAGQYHVKNISFEQPPKTPQQLMIEAQYERRRSAQQTQYNLEPDFTMPDTIHLVPMKGIAEQSSDPPNDSQDVLSREPLV